MPTENKLRVPPFTREDIKAMVEEMNDHVFIDLKGIDLADYYSTAALDFDNGETYQKLLNLPANKIVVFTNFSMYTVTPHKYAIAQSVALVTDNNTIQCYLEAISDDGGTEQFNAYGLTFFPDGTIKYDKY